MAVRIAQPRASGPLLYIGAGVVIDCRFLDRIELARRFADRSELRLVLAVNDTEIGLDFPGSATEAEALMVDLARHTRAAPITSEEGYRELVETARAVATGRYRSPPLISIDGEVVTVDRGLVSTGVVSYLIDAVLEAAKRGDRVELVSGREVPAAVLLLAIAAAAPPDLAPIEQRLADYRETRRPRPEPS